MLRPSTRLSRIVTLICLSASVSQAALATETIDLVPADIAAMKELLEGCDNSLKRADTLARVQDEQLKVYEHYLEGRNKRVAELEASAEKTETNKLIWFGLGMLITGVTVHLVR